MGPKNSSMNRKRVRATLWMLRARGPACDAPQAGEYKGWPLELGKSLTG